MNNNIFEEALVPEDQREHCYVMDGIIYAPLFDKNGDMLKTGKEVYSQYKNI